LRVWFPLRSVLFENGAGKSKLPIRLGGRHFFVTLFQLFSAVRFTATAAQFLSDYGTMARYQARQSQSFSITGLHRPQQFRSMAVDPRHVLFCLSISFLFIDVLPNQCDVLSYWLCSPYVPVPDSGTCCGLPPPLSLIETAALLAPVADGWKVTLIVQLAPAPSVPPQV